jgi:hypothetical protein
VVGGDPGDGVPQPRLKPHAAPQGGHANNHAPGAFAPGAFFVQATDGHRQLGPESSHELHDEPFCSTGIEAQYHLQNAWGLAGFCAHWYRGMLNEQCCVHEAATGERRERVERL